MELGVGLPTFASGNLIVPPSRMKAYARDAESYGFAGLWLVEHLIRPPTYATSWLDPLTSLATIAGETESIPVGTDILNLPMRNPVLVAQRVATIQHLAEREFSLGLGTGYLEKEFDLAGVPFEERGPRFREGLRLLRQLLSGDEVTFSGEFYSVEGFRLEPALSRPPRILVAGEAVERDGEMRVPDPVKQRLRYADGWVAPPRAFEDLVPAWRDFAAFLEENDRNPAEVDRLAHQYLHLVPGVDREVATEKQDVVFGEFVGTPSDDAGVEHRQDFENWLYGDVEDVRERIAQYRDAGFDQLILYPVVGDPGALDRQLRLWRDHLLDHFE